MRKEKLFSILFLSILFLFMVYYKEQDYEQKDESIQQYKLEFESDCECKKNNKITLNYLSDNHYKIDLINKETKQILKTYFLYKNDQNLTCNKFSLLRRGINQKIVSLSLYGKDPFYSRKLINLTRLIKKYYPNWFIRIYHDDTILESIKCEIECQKDENNKLIDNSDFCDINKLPVSLFNKETFWSVSIHKMMWRWLPIGDNFVDTFVSRDSDSLIIQREIDSVQVWLNSNKIGHIMRGKTLK